MSPPTGPPTDGAHLPDPRDRNLSARDRMLVAGLEALVRRGDEVLSDGLHRKRIASITGQSRQTLYTYFPTQAEYLDAMIDLILDPEQPLWPVRDMDDYVDGIVAGVSDTTVGVIDELARRDFDDLVGNEHWRLVVAVWALVGDRPDVRAALGRNWAFYHRRTVSALSHLLDVWDVELRPPWTLEGAAHVFAALSEGLALRSSAIEGDGADLLAITTATLAHAIVAPRGGDSGRFEPRIPADAWTFTSSASLAQIERALAEAIADYLERGERPTFEAMARAAGCSRRALRDRFDSMDDVVVTIWHRVAGDLADHAAGLAPDAPVLERMADQLGALAVAVRRSPLLTGDLLRAALRADDTEAVFGALIDPFDDLFAEAGVTGALAFTLPARAMAEHLVRTAVGVCSGRSGPGLAVLGAEAIADVVWRLTVDGCRVAAAPAQPAPTG